MLRVNNQRTADGRRAVSAALVCAGWLAAVSSVIAQQPGQTPAPQSTPGSSPTAPSSFSQDPLAAPSPPRATFIEPYLKLQETYSNNSTLSNTGTKRGDWVTELGTGVRFRHKARYVSLDGLVGLQAYHAIENTSNRRANPNISVNGRLEAIERFFFIESSVTANRTWASPFAPRPDDGTSVLGNRYTQTVYRVSPYFQGTIPGTLYTYFVRDDAAKIQSTSTSGALSSSGVASDATTNTFTAKFTRTPTPIGWELAYNDAITRFSSGQQAIKQEIARARLTWQLDPIFQVFAIGGYEHSEAVQLDRSGSVYGGGASWKPSPRTNLNGTWEHRYFGPAHTLNMDHRWPGFAVAVTSSRDVTTLPQVVAQFPGGGNVEALLDAQYLTRIPNAEERQQAVQTLIRTFNLPTNVTGALNFISQDLVLRNATNVTTTLIGVRSALAAGVFYNRTEALTGAGSALPGVFGLLSSNTQRGLSLTLSHRISPITDANLAISRTRTDALVSSLGGTSQDSLRLTLTQRLSAKTNGFVGARYQRFESRLTAVTNYNEAGGFVGIDHRF